MRTCTRKLEFDSAHRVMRHESKCRHLHGHRYVVELTAAASELDDRGRVIDFSVLKQVIGTWIDTYWDHGTILNRHDSVLIEYLSDHGHKVHADIDGNPTAENMAEYLFRKSNWLLFESGSPVKVVHVRLYETPNCWADFSEEDAESSDA